MEEVRECEDALVGCSWGERVWCECGGPCGGCRGRAGSGDTGPSMMRLRSVGVNEERDMGADSTESA